MMNLSRWKIGLVAMAVLLGILLSLPNFLPQSVRDSAKGFLPSQHYSDSCLNPCIRLEVSEEIRIDIRPPALRMNARSSGVSA